MRTINIKNLPEIETKITTYLTTAASANDTTLTVKNIAQFAIKQILLIGDLGDENSEIVNTHTSTSPSGSTITLASALSFAHSVNTKITNLLYNQIEISHSSTETGDKTVLDTIDIRADRVEMNYDDTTASSGYYWIRFKNSASNTYSDYTGPIPYTGLARNTVGSVIARALKRNHQETLTEMLDFDFCIDRINECLDFITGKLKRWSKLQEFDYLLGHTERGVNQFTLPSDIWEDQNNKSILAVRVGATDLDFKNKTEWDEELDGVVQTQITTQAEIGDTTLEIDNSYDFDDSGSVNVYISGTLYNITYTGVTRSATAGILTGVPASGTGSITIQIPVDTNVWQGEEEGSPDYYTVYEGILKTWPLSNASYDNLNVYLDYYTAPTTVDSEDDTLDVFRYDACYYWLTAYIRAQLKSDGELNINDTDYKTALQIIDDYIRTELPAHRRKIYPRSNDISY